MTNVLVICAHPDDESLGLGGTIVNRVQKGNDVRVLIFCDGESARENSAGKILTREKQALRASKILGVKAIKFLKYPDEKLDTVSILELVQQIEKFTKVWKPDVVFTHFWGDVNQDHRQLFKATLVYSRPTTTSKIKQVICYETPSSTDWGMESFSPNLFVNIDYALKKKLKAIIQYKQEIQKYPHSRSVEAITNRSKFWGTKVGMKNAEAFISIRELE